MSVQVKTPTKTQFECVEIQCGKTNLSFTSADGFREKSLSFPSPVSLKRSKDDLCLRNDSKFTQPWNRKRRYSQSCRREEWSRGRRRLKSSPYFGKPLPSKFLNGGSIDDPLNLNDLDTSELGKQLNSVTPKSSPLPVSIRRESIEVRIPRNVSDPLALDLGNSDEEDANLEDRLFKRKTHNRHKKKDESGGLRLFSPPKNVSKDKNLMEALKIDIEPEAQNDAETITTSTTRDIQKSRVVCNKIVSPVIRQTSPKSKKRRRTNSVGSKPEPSASTSRSLLMSPTISPSVKADKKTPPKQFKHPKNPQQIQGKGSKSMHKSVPKFIYGNYNRYYGYRNPTVDTDHRLKCFESEWFHGKSVLDIGCNVGHLTLSLARDFQPSKIVGIDIDHKLIAAARKNIRYYISSNGTDTSRFPISNLLNYGPIEAPPLSKKDRSNFPHNVLFMQGNYVLECDELLELQKEEYNVILALSVTKWIHFNWGDDGLKRFFKRIYKQLRPGGRLILEPQPWSSYKKKKKLTDEIHKNFQAIRLRPEQFNDYLLSKEVGFSTSHTVDVPIKASKGFRRPISVFTKSETLANSPYLDTPGNNTPICGSRPPVFVNNPNDDISEDSSSSCCTDPHMVTEDNAKSTPKDVEDSAECVQMVAEDSDVTSCVITKDSSSPAQEISKDSIELCEKGVDNVVKIESKENTDANKLESESTLVDCRKEHELMVK